MDEQLLCENSTDIQQQDLFKCDLAAAPFKDDMASMEYPVFSLSKKPDVSVRVYQRGKYSFRIIPSVYGAATVYDKDLLLYVGSQLTAARNRGEPVSKTVVINSIDFLRSTSRGDGRRQYENIHDMLRRLRSTTIETNFVTGGILQTEGFGIIENYKIREEIKDGDGKKQAQDGRTKSRILSFEITLSDWFFNSYLSHEVLSLGKDYFRLSGTIERRIYEIARKHCGQQPLWKININLLAEKVGLNNTIRKFRSFIRKLIREDSLPDYKVFLDPKRKPPVIVFATRNSRDFFKYFQENQLWSWFNTLERHDNIKKLDPAKAEAPSPKM